MDPNLLEKDELVYELTLRNINSMDEEAIKQLVQQLEAEEAGDIEPPSDIKRIEQNTVTKEIRECEIKLREIGEALLIVSKECNLEKSSAVQARLVHLAGRVGRLKSAVPNDTRVDELVVKVSETGSHVIGWSGNKLDDEAGGALQEPGDMPIKPANSIGEAAGGVQTITAAATKSVNATGKAEVVNTGAIPKQPAVKLNALAQDYRHGPVEVNIPKQQLLQIHPKTAPQPTWFNQQQDLTFPNTLGESKLRHQNLYPSSHSNRANLSHAYVPSYDQGSTGRRQGQLGLAGGHRIRQWALRFSGSTSGIGIDDFLFRVERQAQLDGVSDAALALGIGDLLTDRAAQWFWTFQRKGEYFSWNELKQAFLRRYASRRDTDYELRAKIESRKQRPGENFGDFCQDVEALAVRLTRRMPEDELVEVLRRNMHMRLRKALWQNAIDSVDDLIMHCDEYERLCEEEDKLYQQQHRRMMRVSELEEVRRSTPIEQPPMSNPRQQSMERFQQRFVAALQPNHINNIICWNCKDIGHAFTQCSLPRRHIFCYSCGKDGVLRAQCLNPKCSGNARRDAPMSGQPRPNSTTPQIMMHPSSQKRHRSNNPFSPQNLPSK